MDENQKSTLPVKYIDTETQTRSLQSALFWFTKNNPFDGNLIQEMQFRFRRDVPTAGISYDKKRDVFDVAINPEFFCTMPLENRVAILHHEILHFTNQHLFRMNFVNLPTDERMMWNIAGDIAINQYIEGLPEGVVKVEQFVDDKGTKFPRYQTMEVYYEMLEKHRDQPQNQETLNKFKSIDEHNWEELTEDEKDRMIRQAKGVITRTMEKTSYDHSAIPSSLKDLITYVDTELAKLDYKGILKKIIKRTLSAIDREACRYRPNKRYGVYAPGTTVGKLPNVVTYLDCSGSISIQEQNKFLAIVNGFLKVGSKNCMLGLWHTSLFYLEKYRMNAVLDPNVMESGGTDPDCVLNNIVKLRPNLAIILTDGYYDATRVVIPKEQEILWVISEGGNVDHPNKNIGKTIRFNFG